VCIDAARAGKHVVCEKPLCLTLEDADAIIAAGREAGVKMMYAEELLFAPKYVRAKKLVEEGALGDVFLVKQSEEHAGPHSPWFWDVRRSGGGVLLDMGCHSIAVGRYALTPPGKELLFLQPLAVTADLGLLKWGQPQWREKLLKDRGVDYSKAPAEDFATGMITYRNPETKQIVKAQFTDSWMFEKQGLRLFMDGMGPGYAFELNTLVSPLNLFIGDAAAQAIADQESALEKATASRGLLAVQYNEADLYGYTDENRDMLEAFGAGRDAMLSWEYGLEVQRLVMASYLSAERRRTIDLTDPAVQAELEDYVPLIQQGRGAEQLY
jgi:predicted dehydrogenase